ncbi:hypothetical protein ACXEIS_004884 [Klebsiella variicola]|uniref:hypothetical protein n=1 Tax=Klebsiella variicola TaxID=244366 RepID=UPI0015E84C1F|nr:hypothetical protein [Klebsiella variicola]EIY5101852.1 hypothetical protein [Klebsiella variicola]EIY5158024.1 hypothetical protein [Klebsiella variicola]HCI6063367.1 hypothetical protein [Klebsiella variicola subsp. variicola]HCI7038546.1 hypothetical protein [Klebsiella variicola subsp. variicola]
MPDTVNGLSRLKIVSRTVAVISHLPHAVMQYPVEVFFHFPLRAGLRTTDESAKLVVVEMFKTRLIKPPEGVLPQRLLPGVNPDTY